MCPMDALLLDLCWYPDEDICTSMTIDKPVWVKIQRLYQKGMIDNSECFTQAMLEGIKIARKGMKGIKPEYFDMDNTVTTS